MTSPSKTATKVSTSSVAVAAVTAFAGLGLLGMAAGLLPGVSTGGYVNLRSSVVADKQSIEVEGDYLTLIATIANTGTTKATNVTALQRLAAGTLSFVSAKATSGITCSASAATTSAVACTGGTIAPGASATITIVTKLAKNANTCGTTGTAATLFSVDPANAIEEKDEKDNDAKLSTTVTGTCAAAALPNLTAADIAVATNGLVTATLKNTGAADVSAPFNVFLYVNGTKSMTYSTSTLADVSFMKAGGSSSLSTKTVDLATTTSVKICNDALEAVAESDETDNCSELSLTTGTTEQGTTGAAGTTTSASTASEGIDLTVTKTSSVPSAKQGEPVAYTISVKNGGTVAATSVGVTDVFTDPFVYASATGTNGFACTLSSYTVVCKGATIGAGKTATITVMGSIGVTGLACDTTKTISDVATVDPLDKIVETNENNNKATAQTILTNPCGGSSTVTTTTGGGSSVSSGTTTTTTTGTGTTLK